ncbi:hypothetical protein GX420_00055 [bacterium]|nr:hypothetical protein [bacterium]
MKNKIKSIVVFLLIVSFVSTFKISSLSAVDIAQDFLSLKPFLVEGLLSNVKTEGLDALKQVGGLESFYDVNLLSEKPTLILVGEHYTNLLTLLLELNGDTLLNITKDYPGKGVGVVEFLNNKVLKNIYGEETSMSILIASGSDENGTKNAINYVKQIFLRTKPLKEGVTFVDASLNELNIPTKEVPLEEADEYLSIFYSALTYEKSDVDIKISSLKNQIMEKEIKVNDNMNRDWQDFRGAFLRFDLNQPNLASSYPLGIFTVLADTTNEELCKVALSTYSGSVLDENSIYLGFIKDNVRHTQTMFSKDDYPWNTKTYSTFRKENANEMFILNELYGKVTGDCVAQAIFNEAVFRLWNFSSDNTFTISIGGDSGGHAVNLINSENNWFIFDSTNYNHPIFRDNYSGYFKYFREFFGNTVYTVFSAFGNLYSSKSNMNLDDIKNIALEGKKLFKGDIKFGSEKNHKDNPEAFAPFTKFSNVVDEPFETTIFDAIPEVPQDINATTTFSYLTPDDFYKERKDLLESSSKYLSLLSYNEILDKSIEYPTSQYTVTRYAIQTMRVKNPEIYVSGVFAPRTVNKAKEFTGTYSVPEIINFVKGTLSDIKTISSYSELIDYPDMTLFTKQGTPQSKTLFAYALAYNIFNESDRKNLKVLCGPLSGYIVYQSDGKEKYLDCANGTLLDKRPENIWVEFDYQKATFFNIAPFVEPIEQSIQIVGKNKVYMTFPVRDLNWQNSEKSISCESDKLTITPMQFTDYYKEVTLEIDPTKFDEGNYKVPIKVSNAYGTEEIVIEFNIQKDTTPPKITLKDEIPQFINTTSFSVEFTVCDDDTFGRVKIFANIDKSGYKEIKGTKITLENLSEGQHTILFKAQDESGNESDIQSVTFSVDTTSPRIVISTPSKLNSYTVGIIGYIDDNLSGIDYLKVNGVYTNISFKSSPLIVILSVLVDSIYVSISFNGVFSNIVALKEGENQITFEAIDKAGNELTKTVTVTYIEKTVIRIQIGNPIFTVNGETRMLDSPSIIKNGRTLLPIRAVVEALGGTVEWNDTEKKVAVSLGSNTIELWIGKPQANVNRVLKWIDETNHKVTPEIINGRTILPLRFIAENLGAKVDWDPDTKIITITYNE